MITKNNINCENNCDNTQNLSCSCDQCFPKVSIYNTIDEAIDAANDIHLYPGKTFITYYRDPYSDATCKCNKKVRCIIAVGNAKPNERHIIFDNLVDYKDIKYIKERLENLEEEIIDIKEFDVSIQNEVDIIKNSALECQYTIIDSSTGTEIQKTINILIKPSL